MDLTRGATPSLALVPALHISAVFQVLYGVQFRQSRQPAEVNRAATQVVKYLLQEGATFVIITFLGPRCLCSLCVSISAVFLEVVRQACRSAQTPSILARISKIEPARANALRHRANHPASRPAMPAVPRTCCACTLFCASLCTCVDGVGSSGAAAY
jgi:hypothetical protein